VEREEAYALWLSAEEYAGKVMNIVQQPQVIPVAKVVRHPFYVFFYKRLHQENGDDYESFFIVFALIYNYVQKQVYLEPEIG